MIGGYGGESDHNNTLICEQRCSGSSQMSTDMEVLWKMEGDLRQTAWAGVSRLPFV